MNTIERIETIESQVAETWTAKDGGLTMAASDLLATARRAKELVRAGDKMSALEWVGDGLADTGAESDILDIVREWIEA
jgi:hypothetical protein